MRSEVIGRAEKPQALQIRRRRIQSWHWAPYLFISPFFVLFLAFGLFPLLFSIYLAFHSWDPAAGFDAMQFVGIENFRFVLSDDWFSKSLYNTVWLAIVSGLPQHLVAIPLAYFLHSAFSRWRNGVTGLYFLPFITSSVAIALIFSSLFSRDFGVINLMLTAIGKTTIGGVQPFAWLFPTRGIDWGRPEYTKWMISFVVWWRYVGWNTVLYLSALQTIPRDLYEAATIDGANAYQKFWHITVPLLRPMMFFAVTLTIIGNLQLFEEPFIITGGTGGINQAGKTVAMHLYSTAFTDGDFGSASAIAWLLFMLIAALTWGNNRVFGRKD